MSFVENAPTSVEGTAAVEAACGGAWRIGSMGGLMGLDFNDAMSRLTAACPADAETAGYLLRCLEAGALDGVNDPLEKPLADEI